MELTEYDPSLSFKNQNEKDANLVVEEEKTQQEVIEDKNVESHKEAHTSTNDIINSKTQSPNGQKLVEIDTNFKQLSLAEETQSISTDNMYNYKPLTTDMSEEIEEINVNKTNIENLRSYFDRLKQKTIFNENVNANGLNGNNGNNANLPSSSIPLYNSGIYEKFSNFTGMNMNISANLNRPVFQSTSSNLSSNNMSKLLNNLSINNSQFLEITSNSTHGQVVDDGKKISNFTLFFGGTEKKKEEKDEKDGKDSKTNTSNTNTKKENNGTVTGLNTSTSNSNAQFNPTAYLNYPNYANYPVYPQQYDYMAYNPQRYPNYPEHNPYLTGVTPIPPQTTSEIYGNQSAYEYPQYAYYQYPQYNRMNPMAFPGYQNVNSLYPQYQGKNFCLKIS